MAHMQKSVQQALPARWRHAEYKSGARHAVRIAGCGDCLNGRRGASIVQSATGRGNADQGCRLRVPRAPPGPESVGVEKIRWCQCANNAFSTEIEMLQ